MYSIPVIGLSILLKRHRITQHSEKKDKLGPKKEEASVATKNVLGKKLDERKTVWNILCRIEDNNRQLLANQILREKLKSKIEAYEIGYQLQIKTKRGALRDRKDTIKTKHTNMKTRFNRKSSIMKEGIVTTKSNFDQSSLVLEDTRFGVASELFKMFQIRERSRKSGDLVMPQTNHDFQIMHLPLSKEGWSENMTVPHLNASISLAVQFIQLFCSYMNQSYILHLKFEKGLPFIYEPYLKRKLPLFLLSSKTNRHLFAVGLSMFHFLMYQICLVNGLSLSIEDVLKGLFNFLSILDSIRENRSKPKMIVESKFGLMDCISFCLNKYQKWSEGLNQEVNDYIIKLKETIVSSAYVDEIYQIDDWNIIDDLLPPLPVNDKEIENWETSMKQ